MSDEELTLEGRVKSQMDFFFEDNEVHAPKGEVLTLESRVTVVFEDNEVQTPYDEALTQEGGMQSVNEVVFDLEVCTPVDADALDAESIMSSDYNIVSDGSSEQLYTLVNVLTGDVEEPVAFSAIPTISALLELDELPCLPLPYMQATSLKWSSYDLRRS
ncbi:unnamed protein product [Peronospora belbahrii]|uniref:Uncharacterized protein n=1 Tax=Peronospora belbahrii TaxID=622444 RepID=A0AAU9KYW5_9STRA|nr:unnamed protein product [Peronospora belbahrii]